MRQGLRAAVLIAVCWLPANLHATQINYLIGDKDGFGIGVNPDQPFQPGELPGYDGPGDGDGTDKWFFNQQSFAFSYTLPEYVINAARLEVLTGGQGANAADVWSGAPTSVFLNNTFIGYLTIGDIGLVDNNIARKDVFDLAPFLGLLTGADTFRFRPYSTGTAIGDGWVMDYLELTLQTRAVPEPGTLGLLAFGLIGLRLGRRPVVSGGRATARMGRER